MGEFNSYLNSLNKRLNRQDRQYEAIQKAEEDYQKGIDDSLNRLIKFWEDLLASDGILLNGVGWPFQIVDLYYKASRYEDALKRLDDLVTDPLCRKKALQWQVRILKKQKKDYTRIQKLLKEES